MSGFPGEATHLVRGAICRRYDLDHTPETNYRGRFATALAIVNDDESGMSICETFVSRLTN
jgi:hypothetical protein